jgi:succinate dehydrogenase/fumarate reductase flavoprotein subunit
MVSDYLGLADVPRLGSPSATGDGHRMAQAVGADLWHMRNMAGFMGLRAPGFEAGFPALGLGAWKSHIFVGPDGTRFVDETAANRHGHALLHGRYEIHPAQTAHVVFDEAARRSGPLVLPRRDMAIGWNVLIENYDWSPDNLAEVGKGWILRAGTIEELAGLLRLEPGRLPATVERYNRYCAAGVDEQFGRPAASLAPIAEPPFYGFTSPPLLAWTNGGPRRDERGRVLDPLRAAIPGLFAAGSVSSTYSWCKDGGFHIADALAFGRVAGRSAAARTQDSRQATSGR